MDSSSVVFQCAMEKLGPRPKEHKQPIQTYISLYLPYYYSTIDGSMGDFYEERERKALGALYDDICR